MSKSAKPTLCDLLGIWSSPSPSLSKFLKMKSFKECMSKSDFPTSLQPCPASLGPVCDHLVPEDEEAQANGLKELLLSHVAGDQRSWAWLVHYTGARERPKGAQAHNHKHIEPEGIWETHVSNCRI